MVVLAYARRLAGLLVAFALVTGLPLAAARAACVCAHGHQHGTTVASEASAKAHHVCTSACTADTCPMHRHGGAGTKAKNGRTSDAMRCGCAGEAQALIGQASVAGVLPEGVSVAAPALARASQPTLAETPLSLAASPPAPPPRV